MASTTDYAYARQLVQAYFMMLTVGCQREDCTNVYCCSNTQKETFTATEAAIKSIYFATHEPVPLCFEFEQQQEESVVSNEVSQSEDRKCDSEPQPAEEEENQSHEASDSIEEPQLSKEELHPETPEVEVSTTPQIESISVQPLSTGTSPTRKSTPRQRLSVAVQLDNGLNKKRELPAKRLTVVTRVAVQPKNKSAIDPVVSLPEDVTTSLPETEVVDTPSQQPEHQQQPTKASNSFKDAQRRMSRPKERLFNAIKRSFSRSKKAPLGSR
ncbi:hypothetical protein V7S43_018266 [Phytophthora oleae]|uniref:Ubiquitin-protein ligase E3A N-terminal zinc-binding domain-containing protein n=1 Tax=Phytophthora oleae TaxID=2107226 RepID=A0ABD3EUX0_9STRA